MIVRAPTVLMVAVVAFIAAVVSVLFAGCSEPELTIAEYADHICGGAWDEVEGPPLEDRLTNNGDMAAYVSRVVRAIARIRAGRISGSNQATGGTLAAVRDRSGRAQDEVFKGFYLWIVARCEPTPASFDDLSPDLLEALEAAGCRHPDDVPLVDALGRLMPISRSCGLPNVKHHLIKTWHGSSGVPFAIDRNTWNGLPGEDRATARTDLYSGRRAPVPTLDDAGQLPQLIQIRKVLNHGAAVNSRTAALNSRMWIADDDLE